MRKPFISDISEFRPAGFHKKYVFLTILLCLLLILEIRCATVPSNYPRSPSTALPPSQETSLWKAVEPRLQKHSGDSGFYLLPSGPDAFAARVLLIDAAEKTLDLQYYIFEGGLTGKLILDHLVRAADRGVRVRLLIDDWYLRGKDEALNVLGAYPNMEIRIFNPFGGFRSLHLSRYLRFAMGAKRLKRRMHNKAFVVDNTVAIVGGRNIADDYFESRPDVNYTDIDILAVGPITRQASAVFDEYWNHPLAVPIGAFISRKPGSQDLENGRRLLARNRAEAADSEYAKRVREGRLIKTLKAGKLPLVWARGQVLADNPSKITSEGKLDPTALMGPRLRNLVEGARREVRMISPYFVPGKAGTEILGSLRDRGVAVSVLTNSLASTDEVAVHSGYVRYRKDLLAKGVKLFELKPSPSLSHEGVPSGSHGYSRVALHAKTFIIDREILFVGSFNLDPRSARLDTQDGIVVRSPELAAQALQIFERLTSPANSFQVTLTGEGKLIWQTRENRKTVTYDSEPLSGAWRKMEVKFLSLFSPEEML